MKAKTKVLKFAVQIPNLTEADVLNAIKFARVRSRKETKKNRAKTLLEVLLRLKEEFSEKHFQAVLGEAIRKTENLKLNPDDIQNKIETAVLQSEAHTYEEIAEDSQLPLDVVRRFVGVLVKRGVLVVRKRTVPSTNNPAHLIYHSTQEVL